MDAVPQFIYETTKLIGDASWIDKLMPNEQDIIDIKQYARKLGCDVVVFVYSPNKQYAVSNYTTDYQQNYYTGNVTANTYKIANYTYQNFWYIGFKRTL